MALRGRVGPALGIAAIGSFVAGIIATSGLLFVAPPMAEVAIRFGTAEYVSLMILVYHWLLRFHKILCKCFKYLHIPLSQFEDD